MEQPPKIVLQRLQAAAKPEVHPDPDLLTAFAEKALGERERSIVLEHLAQCADCREVIALAQPSFSLDHVAAVAAALPVPARRSSWLRRPALRWAALAACLVVVSGAVLLRQRELAGRRVAAVASAGNPTAVEPYEKPQTLQAENRPAPELNGALQPEAKPAAPSPSAVKSRALGGFPRKQAADEAGQATMESPAREKSGVVGAVVAAAAPPPPPPPIVAKAAKPAEVSSQPQQAPRAEVPAETETVTVAAGNAPVSSVQAQAIPEQRDQNELKAKDAAAPQADASGESVGGAFAANRRSLSALRSIASAPRWSISQNGTVLRSLDAGKSWQPVPVSSNIVFRAVCAIGSEVWAGGSGGALFHSSDGGATWKKVEPAADGKTLGTEIVAIDFSDQQHGKITTASHEFWTTSDGGQTWQRQEVAR